MTAKEYLQQIKIKNAEINNLIRDEESLRQMMYSLGDSGEGERVQTSRNNDKFGTLYSRIDEKEREVTKKIDELVDFRLKVSSEINALSDVRYIDILYRRYIQFHPWERIAIDMNYNLRHLYHLHGQALLEFETTHKKMLSQLNDSESTV